MFFSSNNTYFHKPCAKTTVSTLVIESLMKHKFFKTVKEFMAAFIVMRFLNQWILTQSKL